MCVRVCVCVCVCVCLPCKRSSETIIIKLRTVSASDMSMHHLLTILTLTFIQCRTDLNHENSKGLINSETIEEMPINFAVKIVQLKDYIWPLPVWWPWPFKATSVSQTKLLITCNISDNIKVITFKLGTTVDLCMALTLKIFVGSFEELVFLLLLLLLTCCFLCLYTLYNFHYEYVTLIIAM